MFTVEESGECKIIESKAGTSIQGIIYNYSDNQSGQIWGSERRGYVEKIESYNGTEIPDEGHTITLDNGKVITFYFMVLEPETEGVQSFFAVKAVASDAPAHEHNPSEERKSDEENHWHECECGEKSDKGNHSFVYGVCSICGFKSEAKDDSADKDENAGNSTTENGSDGSSSGMSSGTTGSADSDSGSNSDKTDSKPESETTDKEYEAEIPDTGNDPLIYAVLFVNLFAAMLIFACFKKRRGSTSES